mmetsp:Transcript_16133/g.41221  ORF Transcript_16133/g.41221 Transcript_16133/m.41221 type:complete len:253 (-) Transcript_16133:262-1020(-)
MRWQLWQSDAGVARLVDLRERVHRLLPQRRHGARGCPRRRRVDAERRLRRCVVPLRGAAAGLRAGGARRGLSGWQLGQRVDLAVRGADLATATPRLRLNALLLLDVPMGVQEPGRPDRPQRILGPGLLFRGCAQVHPQRARLVPDSVRTRDAARRRARAAEAGNPGAAAGGQQGLRRGPHRGRRRIHVAVAVPARPGRTTPVKRHLRGAQGRQRLQGARAHVGAFGTRGGGRGERRHVRQLEAHLPLLPLQR